ncbi:FAD/NAD(P)-binding domain-containing protein [Ramaria rubella]|nr:FAD/NAD(P)-binding domain-containing protein [Ramaria rubella]
MSKNLPILIIGAGVAGPALAISLHQKGYHVLLFEKYDGPAQGGASLNLAPNGLRVLDSLGLAQPLFTRNIATPLEILSYRTTTGPLITSDIPAVVTKHFGHPFAGVKRSVFLKYLVECVHAEGIQIRFNHSLAGLEQEENSVVAIFENGQTVKGAFLIGCDGLHSKTRIALFGNELAEYTGLTQTAGMTLISRKIRHMQNLYGDNTHMISYATGVNALDDQDSGTHGNTTLVSWAVTRPEPESRESWKAEAGDIFREGLANGLDCEWEDGISAKELINGAPEIIKFGLYDRKELSTWYKGRVILIGDAAHPTAPHLGQGANQALEDVSKLTSLLIRHAPPSALSDGCSLSAATLKLVFGELDAQRIPRTSALVRGAREMGSQRVLPSGSKDAEERNRKTREAWSQSDENLLRVYESLLGPIKS